MAKAPDKFSGGLAKKKPGGLGGGGAVPPGKGGPPGGPPGKGGAGGGDMPGGKKPQKRQQKKIGEILRDLGFITEEQLWKIIEQHRESHEPVGKVAIGLGFITDEMLTQALASQHGMVVIDLKGENFEISPEALKTVPEAMCSLYKVLPIKLDGGALTVAMVNPNNLAALDDMRNLLGIEIVGAVANEADIMEAIAKHYATAGESIEDLVNSMNMDPALADAGHGGSIDLDSLEEMADAAPVRKLLNMVLLMAIRDKASDIHLEPFEKEFRMRYRCDGVMYELVPPPKHLAAAISSRIKVMANLDIAERRVPQDGRIELSIGGNPVDLRVSVLPTMFGEGIVMRVLDRSVVNLDLGNIGMPTKTLAQIRQLIHSPHGVMLVTGPTGSGKTTTLYSCLSELNDIETKIITTEDPIEYDIEGIVQVPINPDIEVTFANALRAILRQDPDIILVGEIRDFETAQIAIQASLTGHLVFSTLHTNDSPGAVTRLRDMGVPAFLISATVVGVLAQRLVRKICAKCREEFQPTQEQVMELALTLDKVKGRKFYRGKGCDICSNSGQKGRSGLYELLVCNDEIREIINKGGNKDEIYAAGKRAGMMSLREAGLRAIFEGVTNIDEVVRETIVDEDIS